MRAINTYFPKYLSLRQSMLTMLGTVYGIEVNYFLENAIFMLAKDLFRPMESNFGHFYPPMRFSVGGIDNQLVEKNGRSNS